MCFHAGWLKRWRGSRWGHRSRCCHFSLGLRSLKLTLLSPYLCLASPKTCRLVSEPRDQETTPRRALSSLPLGLLVLRLLPAACLAASSRVSARGRALRSARGRPDQRALLFFFFFAGACPRVAVTQTCFGEGETLAESRGCSYTWPRVFGVLGVPGAGLGGKGAAAWVQQAACRPCARAGQSLQPWERAAKGSKGQRAALARWHRWGQALDLLRLGRSRPPCRHPAGCSPPCLSAPCFVNTRFCSSGRVGAPCKHPVLPEQEGGSSLEPSPGVFPSPPPCVPPGCTPGARWALSFGAVQLPGGVPCAGTGRAPLRGLLPNLPPLC